MSKRYLHTKSLHALAELTSQSLGFASELDQPSYVVAACVPGGPWVTLHSSNDFLVFSTNLQTVLALLRGWGASVEVYRLDPVPDPLDPGLTAQKPTNFAKIVAT